MRRFSFYFVVSALCLLGMTGVSVAKSSNGNSGYTLVANAPGTAALVSQGYDSATAVQLTSTGSSGWGAIGFAAHGLKLRDVTTLSTEYEFLVGSCWVGSPRFTIGVSNGTTKEIYFYIGAAGCASGVWASTGNLATAASPVDDSQLPGGSYADTYAQALAKYGSYAVQYIAIDFDGGWDGSQTALFDNTQVDGTLYTYER